ncbi:hypothetical protein QO010_004678 [Caulobacter ginsengisoli]|uniref:Uncharacterized protein n=1 Tax=Caulobacter ginsengisoli TaxID=400775 RepID=A0ABU0IXY7_9CAUL|nr:hypothetical protein [Caulobacter ginsengisoli]MDQ0466881.1 hypothetical protein [Caulobacter ginsengisoli]
MGFYRARRGDGLGIVVAILIGLLLTLASIFLLGRAMLDHRQAMGPPSITLGLS